MVNFFELHAKDFALRAHIPLMVIKLMFVSYLVDKVGLKGVMWKPQ